ncbi:MAG: T9SS type A sorting domain-containing protein [Bacteroidales bacterium]|jgi:hypothetical protein|nr:T9SS type A sorting domain-containing protein [Bacteroidales bacterium]
MMKKIFILIFFTLATAGLRAQEFITPSAYNPFIELAVKKQQNLKQAKAETIFLNLPFFDDFRKRSLFPDQNLWSDMNAYINDGFCINPPNHGCATFDALDSAGHIYTNASFTSFEADKLTSHFIRLDTIFSPVKRAIKTSDSLYISFYYQPQGRGNEPQKGDSLVLQFYNSDLSQWIQVWSEEGMSIDTFYTRYNTWFRQVMIKIDDSASYYNKNFRFRLVNFASLANNILPSWQSSMDHWNVDFVYLNLNRSLADTIYRNISFVSGTPSFLKRYQSMPYTQYSNDPTNEMRDTLYNTIVNLDTVAHGSRYEYWVLNASGAEVDYFYGGNYSIQPFYSGGYVDYQMFSAPRVQSILPIDPFGTRDSASFFVRHVIHGDEDGPSRLSDTLYYKQYFGNYYAYDDGIPEAGYGLTPSGAQLAYRFSVNTRDTLRGVKMLFNNTKNAANEQYFYLMVWDDDNGIPGKIISPDTLVKAVSANEFGFNEFYFAKGIPVVNAFHVGWLQTTSDNLNVGFDRSADNSLNTHFNTDGVWQQSIQNGSLMIRPVLGKAVLPQIPVIKKNLSLSVYPNPLNGNQLNIKLPDNASPIGMEVRIFDLAGRLMYSGPFETIISLPDLKQGLYFIRVAASGNNSEYSTRLSVIK